MISLLSIKYQLNDIITEFTPGLIFKYDITTTNKSYWYKTVYTCKNKVYTVDLNTGLAGFDHILEFDDDDRYYVGMAEVTQEEIDRCKEFHKRHHPADWHLGVIND